MASDQEKCTSPAEELEGLSLSDGLESNSGGALEEDQSADICRICESKIKSPKVLFCLHEFCEECLHDKLKLEKSNEDESPSSPLAKEWATETLSCPLCGQKTALPEKGISGLLSDNILEKMMESDSDEKQIGCTSCKAGDNAIARCRTCENLLCPNCVTAHQFMRCFEDHNVVTFEEMIKNGEGIDHLKKPIFCENHPAETVKYFCCSCTEPVCGECTQKVHNSHVVKELTDTMENKKSTLKQFANECGNKLSECQKMNSNMNQAFEELEIQKDNTRGLIEETFQSYKATLEEVRDSFLKELDDLHEKRELCLMDHLKKMENYENQLSQAKTFVDRLVERGTPGQIAQNLRIVLNQLNVLFSGFNMPDIPVNTEFKTDPDVFKQAVKSAFGRFSRENGIGLPVGPLGSPFENEGLTLPSMLPMANENLHSGSQDLMNLGLARAPMSLAVGQGLESLPISSIISGPNCMNISHHPDGTVSGNNSPLSDSGISVGNVSHSSGGNAAMINAAAMAKLQQSQSPLFAPGMSIAPSSGNQAAAITSGAGDNSLATMLATGVPVSRSGSTSVQSANIEGLASLLNQPPPSSINTFSNIGSFDHFHAASVSSECVSPDSFSSEPYPPVRRAKMNPMQIRFQGGMGDTEIGHWGPQRNQVNEVPLRDASWEVYHTDGRRIPRSSLRCKFGQLGPGKGQFNSPHGFCLGIEEDIVVADTNNHRIQVFQKTGEFKYQFGIPGREEGQLWYPRKVAVILKSGKFVVCDRGNERSRMQIFNRNGQFLRKIAIRYIDIVAGLAITTEGHIVAVDSVSPTVFCISESGDLIKWFDCSDYMREPSDIAINNGEYYVCDFKGHCVVVFGKDGGFLRRIGCENITNYPNGIDISGHGDVLIGDSHGNRFHVGVFQRDGSIVSEFQCPYVKEYKQR